MGRHKALPLHLLLTLFPKLYRNLFLQGVVPYNDFSLDYFFFSKKWVDTPTPKWVEIRILKDLSLKDNTHIFNKSPKTDLFMMKVLIIDDNFEFRQMVRLFIEDISEEIQELESGEKALESYSLFQPDWVLMDFQMKKVNGIQATKQIIAKYPKAKIVIVTGYNDWMLREKAEKAGVSGFILKENLMVLREILV